MIQSDYALSYNVRNAAYDILESVREFNDWKRLDMFQNWFNSLIEARGRVMLIDICNKIGEEPIDAFTRIGFNSPIGDDNIYVFSKIDGSSFYKIIFPVLNDFTQQGMRN